MKVSSVEAQSGTQNSQEPKPEVKGSTGGSGSVAAIHEGYDHDKVIFTVDDGENIAAVSASDGCKLLLVDSGACENVAKSGDFRAPVDRSKAKPLFSVQGMPLKVCGKQSPEVQVGSRKGTMEMTVTDAAESLLVVNSMTEKGHEVHFTKGESYVVMSSRETMPLEKHGKRWYLRVGQGRPCEKRGSRIAPVGQEDDEDRDYADYDEWSTEIIDEEEFMVRKHNTPRVCLFVPTSKMKGLPVDFRRIMPGRVTKLTFIKDGETLDHESIWTNRFGSQKHMGKLWVGKTVFKLQPVGEEIPEEPVPKENNPEVGYEGEEGQIFDLFEGEPGLGSGLAEDQDEPYEPESPIREPEQVKFQVDDEEPGAERAKELPIPVPPSAEEKAQHELHHANFET